MDRSLDEIASERNRGGGRDRGNFRRNAGRNGYPRDGVQKHISNDRINLESEWVHDMYDDQSKFGGRRQPNHGGRDRSPEPSYNSPASGKLKVENLHYDLTEEDLEDLFNRIGRVSKLSIDYDRAGRSNGVAYVTYDYPEDAATAIREFDGANAKGQPIRLVAMPNGYQGRRPFNPVKAARPLAERITVAPNHHRSRSASPPRHSNVSKPAPPHVDRYIPSGDRRSRSRSPAPRRREGRRPGERRGGRGERGERGGRGDRMGRDGRPKKTQEELDAEMEDYWGGKGETTKESTNGAEAAVAAVETEGDVDMIE